MRIGVIADVHGNALALDAVLEHLRTTAPDIVANLGDLVSNPFNPARIADMQMGLGYSTLAGNHERQVLGDGPSPLDDLARSLLSDAHLECMRGLPATLALADGELFACHGCTVRIHRNTVPSAWLLTPIATREGSVSADASARS